MAVPSSGPLQLYGDIGTELGVAQSNVSLHSMSQTAGFSTPDAMSEFYGYNPVQEPSGLVLTSTTDNKFGSTFRQLKVSQDGNYIILKNNGNKRIYRYPLSTPYNLNTTGSSDQDSSIPARQDRGWAFSTDGLQILSGNGSYNSTIYSKSNSNPFDISTYNTGWSISGQFSNSFLSMNNSYFSSNGSYFYYSQGSGDIRQFILAVNDRLNSSASYQDVFYQQWSDDGNLICVSEDGNYVFLNAINTISSGNFKIYQLSIPYDLSSTKTYLKTITSNYPDVDGYFQVIGNNLYIAEWQLIGGLIYHYTITY